MQNQKIHFLQNISKTKKKRYFLNVILLALILIDYAIFLPFNQICISNRFQDPHSGSPYPGYTVYSIFLYLSGSITTKLN